MPTGPRTTAIPAGSPADRIAQALRPLGYRVTARRYRGDVEVVIEGKNASGAMASNEKGQVGAFVGTGRDAYDDIALSGVANIVRGLTERAV